MLASYVCRAFGEDETVRSLIVPRVEYLNRGLGEPLVSMNLRMTGNYNASPRSRDDELNKCLHIGYVVNSIKYNLRKIWGHTPVFQPLAALERLRSPTKHLLF